MFHILRVFANELIVKQNITENRNARNEGLVLFRNAPYSFHNLGKLTGKAKRDREIAVFRLKLAEFFYPEPVKALTADKAVARHYRRGFNIEFFKGSEHLVRAVAHSVKDNGLFAVFKAAPNAGQAF